MIAPGIILLGREGDPIATRPEWAKDGSFLCFRMLAQRVPEFDAFLSANAIRINDPSAPAELGKELLGARMVGRWKSGKLQFYVNLVNANPVQGAPADLAPLQDDPALGADPQRNNNFDFSNDGDPPSRCPFAAHVRKTNPRTDLPPTGLNPHRIIRRGIAFGEEVTDEEKQTQTTQQNRGLLFVCYQSSLANGFQFIQKCEYEYCSHLLHTRMLEHLCPTTGIKLTSNSLGQQHQLHLRQEAASRLRSYYRTNGRRCRSRDVRFGPE